jgi:hypothetical protein
VETSITDENHTGDHSRPGRGHYWLLGIPFIWQLALAPVVNSVVIRGCPIPFPMLWQMIGIVLSSAVIAVVFCIDKRKEAAHFGGPRV